MKTSKNRKMLYIALGILVLLGAVAGIVYAVLSSKNHGGGGGGGPGPGPPPTQLWTCEGGAGGFQCKQTPLGTLTKPECLNLAKTQCKSGPPTPTPSPPTPTPPTLTWDCNKGNPDWQCSDHGDETGQYQTQPACVAQCVAPVTFKCNAGTPDWACSDPKDGTGQYSTPTACATKCVAPPGPPAPPSPPTPTPSPPTPTPPTPTWDCNKGNPDWQCSDPGDETGQYQTQPACVAQCVAPVTFKCNAGTPDWACSDPKDGTGQYSTLTACAAKCVAPPGPPAPPSPPTPTPPSPGQLYTKAINPLPKGFLTVKKPSPSPPPAKLTGFVCAYNDNCYNNGKFMCQNNTLLEYCNTCPNDPTGNNQLRCIPDDQHKGDLTLTSTNKQNTVDSIKTQGYNLETNASALFCKFGVEDLTKSQANCYTKPPSSNGCNSPPQDAPGNNVTLPTTQDGSILVIEPPNADAASWKVCNACLGVETPNKQSITGPKGNKCCLANSHPHMHICPRTLVGSPQMLEAATKDGLSKTHMYAVVGHDPDRLDKLGIPDFDPNKKWSEQSIFNGQKDLGTCPRSWEGGVDNDLSKDEYVCCQCYEIEFVDTKIPNLIVQSTNTSAGGGSNFDIYMPSGGYGVYNSCYPRALNIWGGTEKDGTKPRQAYTTSYMHKEVPMLNGVLPAGEIGPDRISDIDKTAPWGGWKGGLRGSKYCIDQNCGDDGTAASDQNGCYFQIPPPVSDILNNGDPLWQKHFSTEKNNKNYFCAKTANACKLFKGYSDLVTDQLQTSCTQVWNNNLHFNNKIKRVRLIKCPENLTNVTGCKRIDKNLPDVTKSTDKDKGWIEYTCQFSPADSSGKNYPTMNKVPFTKTTMDDCCKSTCQNSANVESNQGDLDSEYNTIYSCGVDGKPFIQSTSP